MRQTRRLEPGFFGGLLVVCALSASARPAQACGGCFVPAADTTVVTGHRMAFALSEERTVLWDQISYSGAAEDFSWVLPVRPGASLEAATDAWFETLEALTQTTVAAPQLYCGSRNSRGCDGCGVASEDSAARGDVNGGTGDVDVVHEETVGPYETVTLRSSDATALVTWLGEHNYTIPDSILPVIDAYVAEGNDFIALRLSPGETISRMTPVRVVTPGGDPLLPLRMVAAGVRDKVAITLFVLGERRYAMPDLKESLVDARDLVWDFGALDPSDAHNYLDLREELFSQNKGKVHLTTFASDDATLQLDVLGSQNRLAAGFAGVAYDYFLRAQANENTQTVCPLPESLSRSFESGALVTDDAAGPNELASSNFACDSWTDLSSAMTGLHPNKLWITRLEMNLPVSALTIDCVVEPAKSQTAVSNRLVATKAQNAPCPTATPVPAGALPGLSAGGLLGGLVRRKRRPQRSRK